MYENFDKVIIEDPGTPVYTLPTRTTLDQVYKAGWWITEIFGSIAVLVRPKKLAKDGFRLCEKYIYSKIPKTVQKEIQAIADQKWQHYKKRLLTSKHPQSTMSEKDGNQMKIKLCPLCRHEIQQHKRKPKTEPKTPLSYYQRNKDKVKARLAEKRKDPEYRQRHNESSKRSYHKRKEENARTENQI